MKVIKLYLYIYVLFIRSYIGIITSCLLQSVTRACVQWRGRSSPKRAADSAFRVQRGFGCYSNSSAYVASQRPLPPWKSQTRGSVTAGQSTCPCGSPSARRTRRARQAGPSQVVSRRSSARKHDDDVDRGGQTASTLTSTLARPGGGPGPAPSCVCTARCPRRWAWTRTRRTRSRARGTAVPGRGKW